MLNALSEPKVDATTTKSGDAKPKPKKPSMIDIIRIATGFCVFTFSCLYIVILSPLRHLTKPLTKLGIYPHYAPICWVSWFVSKTILASLGVFWECVGDNSGLAPTQNAIYMYNHGSNFDPPVMYGYLGFARQVYKKSLEGYPPLAWAMKAWGYVPIIRENRELAIATMNNDLGKLLSQGYSTTLSPEGTRSMTGELGVFKKGGFHLAVNLKVPIVPVIISGSYELWPPTLLFGTVGTIKIRLLPAIYPKDGETADELILRVRKVMEEAKREPLNPPTIWNYVPCVTLVSLALYGLLRLIFF